MHLFKDKKGVALIFVFVILVALSAIALAFLNMVTDEIRSAGAGVQNIDALYIAEAGWAKARRQLTIGGQAAGWGESDVSLGSGTYTVTTVDNGDGTTTITSSGYIPNDTNPIAKRRVVESNIPPAGSPNLSLDATADGSPWQGGNGPGNAIDGLSNTSWRSTANNGSWLRLDFGTTKTFDKIVYTGSKIDSFSIEYSSNDVDYSAVTGPLENPVGTVNFGSVSARYLRFNVNGNKPSVNELETYNTAQVGLGQGKFSTVW